MRRLLLSALLLAACAPVPAGQPGASPGAAGSVGPDYGDLDPNKPTPVPPGLSGTPNPFASSHPNVSLITFPEDGAQAAIHADYVVGLVQPVDGLVRVSCQARGKDPKGTIMQFSFEAFAASVPEGPGSWTVKKDAAPAPGEARVTHFRGAGTGWVAPSGSVRITKVDRRADVAQWDFEVDAKLEPSGTDAQGRGPSPTPGASQAPSAAPSASAAPSGAPSAAPYALRQVETEFFVRWSGTFYTAPEAGR